MNDVALIGATTVIGKRWRWVVLYRLLIAVLAVAATYLMQPTYLASTAFAPERLSTSEVPAGLSRLAAQFGIYLTEANRPSAFYVSVLESRQIKEAVLLSRFGKDSVPLLTILAPRGRTRAESLAAGVRQLGAAMRVAQEPGSGIIRISVETTSPDLAAAVATRLVEFLNRFNAQQRQAQAEKRRKFIEVQMAEATRAVRDAEDNLRRFYQTNPGWSQSATLVIEGGRLRGAIDAQRDVALTLQREYELARIEEANDTPVLTIVDPAVPPVSKARPRRGRIGVSVFVVGVLLGAFFALVADYVGRARMEEPERYAELTGILPAWRRSPARPGASR